MNHGHFPVAREMNIQFNGIGAILDRAAECGERILRRNRRGTAVGDNERPVPW